MSQSQVYVLFGKSGAGKGTQAKLLNDYLIQKGRKVLRIESGKKLREITDNKENYTSKLTEKLLDNGQLLPNFLPIWVWTDLMKEKYTGEEDIIFDGVCRRETESPIFHSAMSFYGIKKPNIIFINTSDEWSTERLKERGREDDTDESINQRLSWFEEHTRPAMKYFEDSNDFNYVLVNGEQTIEEVNQEIISKLFND